jgi:ribonuclease Z
MLEKLMQPQLDFYCKGMNYPVFFHAIDATEHAVIYEDNTITVETLPQRHRIPCCGFIFREKPKKRHLIGDVANFYNIPAYMRQSIKDGADYTTSEGEIIPNGRLTKEADPSRSYAYCSDTLPCPDNCKYLKNVDLLYHEATFANKERRRAEETFHSTAEQAATIARDAQVKQLVIGHFSSRYDDESTLLAEAREIFPATELAKENLTFKIQ